MGNLQHMRSHFKRVAWVYGHVRNTDPQIVEEIIPCLPSDKHQLNIADIGCGTGRYSKIIAARADNFLQLFCCDYSAAMLQQCRKRMSLEFPLKNTYYCLVNANELPFAHGCFDAVTTFMQFTILTSIALLQQQRASCALADFCPSIPAHPNRMSTPYGDSISPGSQNMKPVCTSVNVL